MMFSIFLNYFSLNSALKEHLPGLVFLRTFLGKCRTRANCKIRRELSRGWRGGQGQKMMVGETVWPTAYILSEGSVVWVIIWRQSGVSDKSAMRFYPHPHHRKRMSLLVLSTAPVINSLQTRRPYGLGLRKEGAWSLASPWTSLNLSFHICLMAHIKYIHPFYGLCQLLRSVMWLWYYQWLWCWIERAKVPSFLLNEFEG